MTGAVLVQYRTRADSAERNRRQVQQVLDELHFRDPGGLRYQVFRLEDGVGFLHVAEFDGTTDPFSGSPAFAAFHAGLGDRLVGTATVMRAAIVGAYGV